MIKAEQPRLALDTSVAIYFLADSKKDGDLDKQRLAESLFMEKKYKFVIPSLVIAELLVPVAKENRETLFQEICKVFTIISVDAKSAELAARAYRTKEQVNSKQSETKAIVKYDALIVGTCLRWQVDGLCTFDGKQKSKFNSLVATLDNCHGVADDPKYFIDKSLLAWNLNKNNADPDKPE
ncbi:MAG: hypothetical protein A2491_15405 [Bacteroidetes bacterium RIFOXYC12_FULL_35_7]|nr:MAG: hypothetical protein A2491_15405 [Bacteroidetes bacterium RIFOXYC12_FULL_35_7]